MNKYMTVIRRKLLFLLIPSLIGIAYLGSTVISSSAKKDKSVVRVNNLTRFCELLNVEKHKNHIRASVHNNNDKAITAFVIFSRIDPKTIFTFKEEFAFSEGDVVILPGQTRDEVISIPDRLSKQSEITLNLSAVIYDDKSSEGDPATIHDIEENRLGQKIQLMKVLPVIEKALRLSDNEMDFYWDKTAGRDFDLALSTPDREWLLKLNNKDVDNHPSTESEQFKLGVQAGKEAVAQKYQELKEMREKQGIKTLRDQMITLRDLYLRMAAKV